MAPPPSFFLVREVIRTTQSILMLSSWDAGSAILLLDSVIWGIVVAECMPSFSLLLC